MLNPETTTPPLLLLLAVLTGLSTGCGGSGPTPSQGPSEEPAAATEKNQEIEARAAQVTFTFLDDLEALLDQGETLLSEGDLGPATDAHTEADLLLDLYRSVSLPGEDGPRKEALRERETQLAAFFGRRWRPNPGKQYVCGPRAISFTRRCRSSADGSPPSSPG